MNGCTPQATAASATSQQRRCQLPNPSSKARRLLRPLALLAVAVAVAALPRPARAVEPAPIVVSIEADSTMTVVIPDELMERLQPAEVKAEEAPAEEVGQGARKGTAAGYRVQVFSDNNQRTARNEARSKEAMVAGSFPQWRTYKKYTAPYWRLRVGDFRSQREAEEAAAQLRKAFPALANEIRVVNDRINL